eukprot:gene25408-biopygen23981
MDYTDDADHGHDTDVADALGLATDVHVPVCTMTHASTYTSLHEFARASTSVHEWSTSTPRVPQASRGLHVY